jgi:hypothetical protein
VDLPSVLSDLVPPLVVVLAKFGADLYMDHRRSRRSGEEPRGKHEKQS